MIGKKVRWTKRVAGCYLLVDLRQQRRDKQAPPSVTRFCPMILSYALCRCMWLGKLPRSLGPSLFREMSLSQNRKAL